MAPVQAILLPINDALVSFAREQEKRFVEKGLRCEVDDRAESLNKKIREAQMKQIPLIMALGEKEKASGAYSVRTLDGKVVQGLTPDRFFGRVLSHVEKRSLDPISFSG